jgi:hypothetical protein
MGSRRGSDLLDLRRHWKLRRSCFRESERRSQRQYRLLAPPGSARERASQPGGQARLTLGVTQSRPHARRPSDRALEPTIAARCRSERIPGGRCTSLVRRDRRSSRRLRLLLSSRKRRGARRLTNALGDIPELAGARGEAHTPAADSIPQRTVHVAKVDNLRWSLYGAHWLQRRAHGKECDEGGPPAESCSARPRETKGGPLQCCTPVWISVASVSTFTCSTLRARRSRSVRPRPMRMVYAD